MADTQIDVKDDDVKIAAGVEEPAVEVVDAAPEKELNVRNVVSADKGVEDFKAKFERAEQARRDAERRATEAEQRLTTEQKGVTDHRTAAIDNNIALLQANWKAANTQSERLEEQYARALSEGDHMQAAKVQREMVKQQTYLTRFEEGLNHWENVKKQPVQRPQPPQTQRQDASPTDQWISQLAPASRDWANRHRDIVENPRTQAKMIAGHHDAIAEGLQADTPEYFSHIERHLGLSGDTQADPPPRRQASVAAPPNRQSVSGMKNATKITMSEDEKSMARDLGMTVEQYAKNKLRVKLDGKYDRTN